jgi:hypothetical protein
MKNYLSLLALKQLLKPMGKITSIIQDDCILFQKDNITFAKLDKDGLYFLNKANEFYPAPPNLIEDLDQFLITSTKSYYFAAGNRKCA